MKFSASFRYGVIGVYKDREPFIWHVYPVPFIRITIWSPFGRLPKEWRS